MGPARTGGPARALIQRSSEMRGWPTGHRDPRASSTSLRISRTGCQWEQGISAINIKYIVDFLEPSSINIDDVALAGISESRCKRGDGDVEERVICMC